MTPDAPKGAGEGRAERGPLDDLLARLNGHIDSERLRGAGREKRLHERRPARLLFEYRIAGDETAHGGRLLDISRGGLRCLVTEELRPGDILALAIKSPEPGALEGRIDAYGEVVRLWRRGRVFELGVSFVHPQPASSAPPPAPRRCQAGVAEREEASSEAGPPRGEDVMPERRRHRRLDATFELSVRRADGSRSLARVRNISAGGMDFLSEEAFDVGEELAVRFGARRTPGLEGTLSSGARVLRVRRLGERYEVAAVFVR